MVGLFLCTGGVHRAPGRFGALALAAALGLIVLPGVAAGECFERMSRIPLAAPAAAAAPTYRAHMLRAAGRPRAAKAHQPHAVRKARPAHKASLHRAVRRKPPIVRRAAAPAPTPMAVAAAALATPRSYALISDIVCDSEPAAVPVAPPRLTMALVSPAPDDVFPGPDTGIFLPPPTTPFPEEEWPATVAPVPGGPPFIPPEARPPTLNPPQVTPPAMRPPTGQPPLAPPLLPPPLISPPVGPPVAPPPTAPIPEPATWTLMILGFGVLGVRLRRRSGLAG